MYIKKPFPRKGVDWDKLKRKNPQPKDSECQDTSSKKANKLRKNPIYI